MDQNIFYRCEGSCGGVSPIAKNCSTESCTHFAKPLKARRQCPNCAAKTAQDGQPHACSFCQLVE